MSKDIDRSKSLSKADAKYLSDRGLLSAEEEAKYGIKPTPEGGNVDLGENTGDVDTATTEPDGEEEGESTEMPDDYNEWSKADLQAEAEARGLSRSGTIAELAERLQADDAAEGDEE